MYVYTRTRTDYIGNYWWRGGVPKVQRCQRLKAAMTRPMGGV